MRALLGFCIAVTLLVSARANAGELKVPFHAGVQLRTALLSSDADLQVMPDALLSEHGVRPEASDKFRPFVSLAVGGRYVARAAHEMEYVVVVKSMQKDGALLSIEPRDPTAGQASALLGKYKVVSFQIEDLEPSQPSYPELQLFADGSYKMGGARGTWFQREGHLALSGYYEAWGLADISGDGIIFKFPRAGSWVEVTLAKQIAAAVPETASASR